MPVWRLQSEVYQDTVLPRDAMTITPHFNDSGVGTDPQGLCDDLADALVTFYTSGGAGKQVRVTAYDAQGSQPVEPQGQAIRHTGLSPVSPVPREIAVCLSYFSGSNRPRYRGRLYVPLAAIPVPHYALGARLATTGRVYVGGLAQVLADLGGPDVDWCVWSRVDGVARPVTNWWVDDEWDTIRSRGLRSVARTTGTVNEA